MVPHQRSVALYGEDDFPFSNMNILNIIKNIQSSNTQVYSTILKYFEITKKAASAYLESHEIMLTFLFVEQ